jgi:hypothetical protein
MTVLEALQSFAEYDNENLLSKVLADNRLSGTDTYDPDDHQVKIDLACADLYEHLATHPEMQEESSS